MLALVIEKLMKDYTSDQNQQGLSRQGAPQGTLAQIIILVCEHRICGTTFATDV